MQRFAALLEEKRRLLDTTREDGTTSLLENDVNRRMYTVVQRMSAFDRYKRKRKNKKSRQEDNTESSLLSPQAQKSQPKTATTEQGGVNEAKSDQQLSPEWIAQKSNRLSQMQAEVDECRERLVNFDGWKRLADEMQKDVHVYEKFANMLRGQPSDIRVEPKDDEEESNQIFGPLSEHEQRRNSFKEFAKDIVKQVEECRAQNEIAFEEEDRRIQARLEEQKAQIDERHAQARARRKLREEQRAEENRRKREESEERSRKSARFLRQFDKRMEDHKWQKEWRSRRPLVMQRRVDQSANAG